MDDKERKKIIIIDENSREHVRTVVSSAMINRSLSGDIDAMKLFREIDAEDQFNNFIKNSDDDEYEFAY